MSAHTRLPHWEESLSLYLDRVRDEPFLWGTHDCWIFAGGICRAVTGEDVLPFLGPYDDKLGACQVLRENGAGNLRDTVSKYLGEPTGPAHAGKGDIVMLGKALGVSVGHWSIFVGMEQSGFTEDGVPVHREGLIYWPTLQCEIAWKVAPVEERN